MKLTFKLVLAYVDGSGCGDGVGGEVEDHDCLGVV